MISSAASAGGEDPDACWSASAGGFCFATNADHDRFMEEGPTVAIHLPSLPQGLVDAAAGFGDVLSFGGTRALRSRWGIGSVDYDSGFYMGGQAAGFVTPGFGAAAGLRGAAYLGRSYRWLNTGRHWRIGPGVISRTAGTKPFNYGAGRNIPMLRIGNGTPSSLNHFDLRIIGK